MTIEPIALFQTHFPSNEFARRRQHLTDQVETQAVVLLSGKKREHELESFRQSNNLFYSGLILSFTELPEDKAA